MAKPSPFRGQRGIALLQATTATASEALETADGAAPASHTHAQSDITGLVSAIATINTTLANITSGVYTPTRSAEANLDGNIIPSEAQYLRVGNTVAVSGRFTADPTLTATATSFELTLPVASNLGATEDLAGMAFCGQIAGLGAAITGSAANNTAVITWVASDINSNTWSYILQYQVI